jgi:hypothetical protein
MIDDFCLESGYLWINVGKDLLQKCIDIAKSKNAKQILVVCDDHDIEKYKLP